MTSDIVARAVIAALSLWIPFAAFVRESSMPAIYRGQDGAGAYPFLIALAVAGCVMVSDLILNETTSRKLWRSVMPHRDALYLAVAFLSLLTPYSVSRLKILPPDSMFFFCIIFFGAVGLCVADARAKRGYA